MTITDNRQGDSVPGTEMDSPSPKAPRRRAIAVVAVLAALVAVTAGVVAVTRPSSGKLATKAGNTPDADIAETTTTTGSTTTTIAASQQASTAAPSQCSLPTPGASFPDPRLGAALAPTATGLVVWGGRGADFTDRSDTWSADCETGWQGRRPTTAPKADASFSWEQPAAAYDEARSQVVLVVSGKTWVWDGSDWAMRGRAPLSTGAAVYDANGRQVVLVGAGSDAMETWAWDGAGWKRLAVGGPASGDGFALVYDGLRARTYLFGGRNGDAGPVTDDGTWAFDGAAWTHLSPAHSYPAGLMTAAFDPTSGRTVALAFSGAGGVAETWAWDGTDWTRLPTLHTPTRRSFASSAWIPAMGRVVLFGGKTSVVRPDSAGTPTAEEAIVNDLWAWEGSDWTQIR